MADKEIRPFSDWLADQRNGVLQFELSEALNTVVDSVNTTGKPGYFTLKINVKPSGKDSHGAVVISDLLTVKAPESHPEVFYFVDSDGNPSRENERQLPFSGPILEVSDTRPEPKEVR